MFRAWFEGLCLGRSRTIVLTTISRRIYVTCRVKASRHIRLDDIGKLNLGYR
jgi:hypothetical protein